MIFMAERTYKKIELTGSSTNGIEDAVNNAIAKASGSVRNMRWFEVIETRGSIDTDKVQQWQVTVKVGFALD
jgi:flavin-binding protein dodecin